MEKFLLNWESKDNRQPLIIRGARQIGKTYSISYFGKSNYKYFININFVNNPKYSYVKYGIKLFTAISLINLFNKKVKK